MTAATAAEALPVTDDQRIQDAVRGVVEWFEDSAAYRKRHGLPRYEPAPAAPADPPTPPIDQQPCVDCGQIREHMLVFGLPGSACRDYRRCVGCTEALR